MSKFKSFLNWFKNPKIWFVMLYLILSIALITASIVVVSFGINNFWAYLLYSLTMADLIYLIPNSITGGIICLIIVALGIYMFISGQKQIEKVK